VELPLSTQPLRDFNQGTFHGDWMVSRALSPRAIFLPRFRKRVGWCFWRWVPDNKGDDVIGAIEVSGGHNEQGMERARAGLDAIGATRERISGE
jgi:hypothetical protein